MNTGFDALRRAAARCRRKASVSVVLTGLASALVVYLLSFLAADTSLYGRGSPAALLLTAALVAALGATVLAWRRARRRLAVGSLVPETEASLGLRDGELSAALELESGPAPGTSGPLASAHVGRVARRLEQGGNLLPASTALWTRRSLTAGTVFGVLAVGALATARLAPDRARRARAALLAPWAMAFPPPLPPIRLHAGGLELASGTRLRLEVEAPGRSRVTLRWQAAGEPPEGRPLALSDGGTVAETAPITSPTAVWAEDPSGARSDTLRVRPVAPLFVSRLQLRVRFPGYLGRPDEEYAAPVPPLRVPAGSRVELAGTASRPLAAASLHRGGPGVPAGDSVALDVDGSDFSGRLRPSTDGSWGWRLEAMGPVVETALPDSLRFTVTFDSAPSVRITEPGRDTVLSVDLRLPLVVEASDDQGLASAELVSWRKSALGTAYRPGIDSLPGARAGAQRMVLRPVLDLQGRDFLPGDTLYYFARVRDRDPSHRPAVSDTFRARLPDFAEVQETAARAGGDLAERARGLVQSAEQLGRDAGEAGRRTGASERLQETERAESGGERSGSRAGNEESSSQGERQPDASSRSYGETEEGRRVLDQGEQLQRDVERMHGELQQLREKLDRSGLSDPELRRQLERVEKAYREIMQSGLKEQIEALRKALQQLDPESVRRALQRMSADSKALHDRAEQAAALLERVAMEQALKAARSRAEQLAREQRVASSSDSMDARWAADEKARGDRSEQLSRDLEKLSDRLGPTGASAAADSARSAAGQTHEAAGSLRQAAASGAATRRREQAKEGARALQRAAQSLSEGEQRLTQSWQSQATRALDRAGQDALSLAGEQSEISRELRSGASGDGLRGRQSALQEGLENLVNGIADAGRKTALLDRQTGPAAARARKGMQELLGRMTAERPGPTSLPGDPAGLAEKSDEVAETLNDLAVKMLSSSKAVQSSGSATGMQEALEQMARMAGQQGQLSRESGGLLPMGAAGGQIDQELQRLADEQRKIARGLRDVGRLPGSDQLLGRPGQMAAEADSIADQLAAGRLDQETVDRQQRLFHHLLDAGRTLEQDQRDPSHRESRTARGEGAVPAPPPLTSEGVLRYPLPSESELRDLPPGYRGLVLDYFERLNRASDSTEAGGE